MKKKEVLRYTIPDIPPSNNKYIGRDVRWQYQNEKKRWTALVRAHCRPVPAEPMKRAIVVLHYHFPTSHRRDPDNYSGKMLLDGLVRAGIIADDSFKCITLMLEASCEKTGRTTTGKKKGRTEITVAEL